MGHPTGNFGHCGAAAGASVVYWARLVRGPPGIWHLYNRAPCRRAGWHGAGAPAMQYPPACGTGGRGRAFQPLRAAGVLSGRSSGGGAALISLDGKLARRFAWAQVDSGLVLLQSLGRARRRWGVGGWPHHGAPGDASQRADGSLFTGPAFLGLTPRCGRQGFSSTTRYVCCNRCFTGQTGSDHHPISPAWRFQRPLVR